MDDLYWKTLLKWMIWGYPYFWKHPFRSKQSDVSQNCFLASKPTQFQGDLVWPEGGDSWDPVIYGDILRVLESTNVYQFFHGNVRENYKWIPSCVSAKVPPSSWPRCRSWLQSKGFEFAMVCSLAKRDRTSERETRVAAGAHVQQKDVIKRRLQVVLWLVGYMVSQLPLTQMDSDHWVLNIGYCPSNFARNHRYTSGNRWSNADDCKLFKVRKNCR